RQLFETLRALDAEGAPIETHSVAQRLKAMDAWDSSFLFDVQNACPTIANFDYYCGLLKDLAAKRHLSRLGERILRASHNGEMISDVLANAQLELEAIRHRNTADTAQGRLELTNLADAAPTPVSWLWPNRIACGKVTVIAGDPGPRKVVFVARSGGACISRH